MALSPMMQQYMEIKEQYADCVLFFRLGDFYEMFFDDALEVSKALDLTLTGRNCGLDERAPMCGVPYHSSDIYLARLVEKGYKVAVCEQVENPSDAVGIVKREVIRIVTPGTVTNSDILSDEDSNYLVSIYINKDDVALAYCDISTGEFRATKPIGDNSIDGIQNEIIRLAPKEIIVNKNAELHIDIDKLQYETKAFINIKEDNLYNRQKLDGVVTRQFGNSVFEDVMAKNRDTITLVVGMLLDYLFETQKQSLSNLTDIEIYVLGEAMSLDKATIRNLELTETLADKTVKGSLLGVLDKTHTAMGGRKLKSWIREPLNNLVEINDRLDSVEFFVEEGLIRNNIKESLKRIYDFDRILSKIVYASANAKDLISLKTSLVHIPDIKYDIQDTGIKLLDELESKMDMLDDIKELIEKAIVDDPPFSVREGGLIRYGFDKELDEINDSIKEAKEWIAGLEEVEKKRTGITNLKVGYNKVFGYYIDVTKSHLEKVPEDYIRKQTLSNSERYIIPKLKEMENLVLSAQSKINDREYSVFVMLREEIAKHIIRIQNTSTSIGTIDALVSFAHVSDTLAYVKPNMTDDSEIKIVGGRHPVIEDMIKRGIFVPNDLYMNDSDRSMLLITGPNMAGKSTYMRQTALIVLMAQIGCFVPCDEAQIGVVDRIFTRIGASDNLVGGQSTFFVEMSELSTILRSATEKSLIILDEIGRGTSTYDGLSIAWAVVEYLCTVGRRIRTLFATHYHELTELTNRLDGIVNLTIDVVEQDGEIVFLHKIVEGMASRSYGIHVARLAGVPDDLLSRAEEKLYELENASDKNVKKSDTEQISFKL
ncbi:MAG: DNA mismatch repair protein MutS [Eubacteriales bacterium]|nr:DNA mismatch repair protein MutS [Eubacteriales bacterium]MDY3333222.1 DNA mismatch repair protein MutS [Gallibacter sp.]